jgi:hypothetical protein
MVEVYATVQSLHHRVIMQKLQQYGPCAASLPGFVYACAFEVLRQQWTAQPGANIELQDLQSLAQALEAKHSNSSSNSSSSSSGADTALASMASDLIKAASCGSGGSGGSGQKELLLDD